MSKQFIDTLSEEWILYIINPNDLALFKKIAAEHDKDIQPYIPSTLEQLNIYVTICNVWFTLRSHQKTYYLDETRRMNYAAAYIQLEFVERHTGIKQFIQTHKLNNDGLFSLAFFISIELMTWVMDVMHRAEQQAVIDHYMQKENFIQFDTDPTSTEFKQSLLFQKIYVKEMIRNIQETTELEDAIQVALNQTRQRLQTKLRTPEL